MEGIKVITAVNEELWREYALKTTATWQFPHRIYHEQDQLEIWRLWRERNHVLHPELGFKHTWQRFSHKVEAQCRALLEYKHTDRYLIWLDADVVQLKVIPDDDVKLLVPREGDMCSYLGRGDHSHPETGWICYDLTHPRLEEFIEELTITYLSDQIFALPQWHDAHVWDHVCRELKIPRTDLGPGTPGEAFGRSPLRDYFLHLKGSRKTNIHTGQTREELMHKPRGRS